MSLKIDLPSIPPRWYQLPFLKAFDLGTQFNLISWPRRSGKDVTSFASMVSKAIQKPGNYYYLFPTRAWAQRALWDNICDWAGGARLVDLLCPKEIVARKNNVDYFLDLKNGSRIKIDGTDNLNFVGQGGAGYVLSEYSLHKDEVFGFLAPILNESGAWVLTNGTMRGKKNLLYQLYERNLNRANWFSQWYTLEDTKTDYWIDHDGEICINPELAGKINPLNGRPFTNIQELVDSGAVSYALARQEFLNLADGDISGSYYSYEVKAMYNRGGVRRLDPMDDLVYTFWDLGGQSEQSDTTCIVFAQYEKHTKRYRVVDYYENTGKLRGHYFEVIAQRGYKYGGHFFPHDAKRTNEWTGETSADTARNEYGVEVRFVPKTNLVVNDIEICRRNFKNVEFDDTRTQDLITHVSMYHEKESTGKPCHQNNCAECRGASHGADAFRAMIMAGHLGLITPYLVGEEDNGWERQQDEYDLYNYLVV